MEFNKIVEEIYNSGYGGQYPAYSEPPRKDFAPMSNKSGYDNPYRRDGAYGNLPEPQKEGTPSMPWPLQTLSGDISDSFVYLMSGMSKLIQCIKQNPVLDKDQKKEMIEIYKKAKVALSILKKIGISVDKFNMAKPQPVQDPTVPSHNMARDTDPLSNMRTTIAIKLP
jgi:hypothetical protein